MRESASDLKDLRSPAGNRLEKLDGDRANIFLAMDFPELLTCTFMIGTHDGVMR